MPTTLTKQRRQTQALYASLSWRKPGSPETLEAGREFWFVKTMDDLLDSLARSPLPFTDEQRQRIAELLAAG
jgi:hypothetical protein